MLGAVSGTSLFSLVLSFIWLPETHSPRQDESISVKEVFYSGFKFSVFTVALLSATIYSQTRAASVITSLWLPESSLRLSEGGIGLVIMCFGIGGLVGSLIGGKLADLTYDRYGSGGRLLVAISICVLQRLGLCLLGLTFDRNYENSLWAVISLALLLGTFSGAARSSDSCFVVEVSPKTASASLAFVSACDSAGILLYVTVMPLLLETFSPLFCFIYLSLFGTIFIIPATLLAISTWGTKQT